MSLYAAIFTIVKIARHYIIFWWKCGKSRSQIWHCVCTSGKNNKAALAVQHSPRHIFILKTYPWFIIIFTPICGSFLAVQFISPGAKKSSSRMSHIRKVSNLSYSIKSPAAWRLNKTELFHNKFIRPICLFGRSAQKIWDIIKQKYLLGICSLWLRLKIQLQFKEMLSTISSLSPTSPG